MTIAAGFVTSGGVLLCADTMYQSNVSQTHQPKVIQCPIDEGCGLTFALAGNESFARMAIEDCCDVVRDRKDKGVKDKELRNVRSALRNAIKAVNEQYVDTRPPYEIDGSRFELLICIWLASERKARLFATTGVALAEVPDFELRGSGSDIGRYTVGTAYFSTGMHMDRVSRIAFQAIAAAKSYDPSCGGNTTMLGIRNSDGESWGPGLIGPVSLMEDFIRGYWRSSGKLLTHLSKLSLEKREIDMHLKNFLGELKRLRKQWESHEKNSMLTAEVISIGSDPADAPRPQPPKRDR